MAEAFTYNNVAKKHMQYPTHRTHGFLQFFKNNRTILQLNNTIKNFWLLYVKSLYMTFKLEIDHRLVVDTSF